MTPNHRSSLTTDQGTNPHAAQTTSLVALGKSLWRHRQLIAQMTGREVMGRYKGSVMGLAWSFFNPVFMLVVYTFVFSVIFKFRWGVGGEESKTQFAVVLFVGMIVHGMFKIELPLLCPGSYSFSPTVAYIDPKEGKPIVTDRVENAILLQISIIKKVPAMMRLFSEFINDEAGK